MVKTKPLRNVFGSIAGEMNPRDKLKSKVSKSLRMSLKTIF